MPGSGLTTAVDVVGGGGADQLDPADNDNIVLGSGHGFQAGDEVIYTATDDGSASPRLLRVRQGYCSVLSVILRYGLYSWGNNVASGNISVRNIPSAGRAGSISARVSQWSSR